MNTSNLFWYWGEEPINPYTGDENPLQFTVNQSPKDCAVLHWESLKLTMYTVPCSDSGFQYQLNDLDAFYCEFMNGEFLDSFSNYKFEYFNVLNF